MGPFKDADFHSERGGKPETMLEWRYIQSLKIFCWFLTQALSPGRGEGVGG